MNKIFESWRGYTNLLNEQQEQGGNKQPLVVWIRDEKGNLIKVPELEGLRYFQNMAKQTQDKARQAEEELNALRKANDEQLKTYRQELTSNLKADNQKYQEQLDLHAAVNVIYMNMMGRLLKKMQEFHANRDEKSAQALANLTKNIGIAYTQLDLVKLKQFEKNISSWA